MSGAIFDTLLVIHVIFALAWLGSMIAGIFPALTLINAKASNASTFKRGLVLSRIIAGTGGIAVVFGVALYYYINFVDKTYATSASGLPLIGAGAAFGVIAFALSTYESSKLRRGYRARIEQASSMTGTQTATVPGTIQPTTGQGPPKSLVLVTPVVLVVALVLMVIGSMI
jgi:hypothetical protein